MTDLRELLTGAVPDPPSSDDLVERVGVVVRRRRRRRATAAMGVAAVVAALAVVAPNALLSPEQQAPVSGFTAERTDPALCPPPHEPQWRKGDPVPTPLPKPTITDVPTGAALCKYQDGRHPVSRIEIGPGAAAVLDAIDAVPEHTEIIGCTAVFHDTYQVVFSFADRELVVHLNQDCWSLSYAGHARNGDVSPVLDEFAATFRAEGGDYPPPPWEW